MEVAEQEMTELGCGVHRCILRWRKRSLSVPHGEKNPQIR